MSSAVRPRRSVLYMPGSKARALEKARTLAADGLIFDLEDGVAPGQKAAARDAVVAAIRAGGYGGRERVIRVNGFDTEWGALDLAAAATSGAHAVLVPKVESADHVNTAAELLIRAGAPEDLTIWCMMETPRGILHAKEIATASPRVACLVMGTSDLAKDLHAHHTPDRLPFVASLGLCVLAARAHGLAILDGVHLDLSDDEGFRAQCRQGLEFGFDGKTLIHPKTIAAANEIFAPGTEDIAWSERIIAAFESAQAEGKGVVLVDGQLIETLHVENARRIVALADAIAALDTNLQTSAAAE